MVSLEELTRWHQRLRPELEVVDVYKMLFQSVYGVQHILQDTTKWRLEEELSELEPLKLFDEPLIEGISVDNAIVRINLSPFKVNKLPSDKLFLALATSIEEIRGTQKTLLRLWSQFRNLVEARKLSFDTSDLQDFDDRAKKENYPPYHHSAKYKRLYRPAYRVVKREVFRKIFNID